MIEWLIYYELIVNLLAFVLFGVDKYKAKRGQWRISEWRLMLLSLFGGGEVLCAECMCGGIRRNINCLLSVCLCLLYCILLFSIICFCVNRKKALSLYL